MRLARTVTFKRSIMRVDSPGGSAVASDAIWREVLLTQREKPVIVSMSDVAGSGGYYIAMAAGTIVAEPGTITGSIGVLGGKLNLKGFYNKDWTDKRGYHTRAECESLFGLRRFHADRA